MYLYQTNYPTEKNMKKQILITTLLITTAIQAAPKLHVILTADTNAQDISHAVAIDKQNMNRLFADIAEHFDDSDIYSLSADSLSEKSINIKLKALKVGIDDVLVFYYSGHGDRSKFPESPWPRLTPHNGQSIEVKNILGAMNDHMARQVVVIIDACNGEFHEGPTGQRWPASSINKAAVDKLFKNFHGNVVVTSSKPDLVSYTLKGNYGSQFTYVFKNVMQQELSQNETDWGVVLEKTKEIVVDSDKVKIQTPKFIYTKNEKTPGETP